MPGIAAAQLVVNPSPLKLQQSKRSRKTPQSDLVPRRTPRHTKPSAQPLTRRSSRCKNGTAPNKKVGKPSSLDPTNGGTQDGAVITLSTNLEGPAAKEGEFIPTVADEANHHAVGLPLVPGGQDSEPTLNEVTNQPKPVKPQENNRKNLASIGQYSKTKPTLATSSETTGYATPPDIADLNLVNTGPNEALAEEAIQEIVAPHTPEKQTGWPNLTDIISPTNAAQSPGEIRRRLIAIAQSSLKRLRLELPDEAQETEETEETLIQPSIEASAPINYGSELTVAAGAGNSNESRVLDRPQSNLPDLTGTISPIVAAPHERENSTSIDQHSRKRPKLTHVIEDPEIVARPYMEGQESAVFQQAPAAEPQGGEVKEEPKSKSPAQGFGDAMSHHDEPLEHPPHEDLARQDSLQEDQLHDDPPDEKPPPEDPPDEDPPREPSVENDDGNSGAALSITKPKTKPKRKKRKAIGQQSLRKKAKPAVKPTIRRPAPNPASKYQVTHKNETSKVKSPEKAGSSQVAQFHDDDDEEDLLHTSNYEPTTGLARGLGGKLRAADVKDSIVGRKMGGPGMVDNLATRKGRMSINGSDNEPRNETGFGRAKKATIKTSPKLQLRTPSKRSKTSTIAKQNMMIKKIRVKSSLNNEPSSLDDDNFWHVQRSGSDEPIKPLSRRRGPRLQPPLEEEDELRVVDRRGSIKTDSFDKGEDGTEEELGGIDPIALERGDFAGQDEYFDEHSNDGDAGRTSTKAINKSYQRLQSQAANPSKTTKPPKARPRVATRKPPKNSIPIKVYRMPSTHDLDPDTDDSNQTNDTINAVDILAQCREQISKSATSASEATNQESNRAEKLAFERKAKAIKMYGDELDLELLHLVSPIHPSTFSQSFPHVLLHPSIHQLTQPHLLQTQTLNTKTFLSSSSRQRKNRELQLRAELSSLQGAKSALVKQGTDMEFGRDKLHRRRRIYALLGEIRDAVKQGRELDGYDHDDMGGSAAAGVVKVSASSKLEGGQIDDGE